MASKELQARCRVLAERVSESIHIIDHDPSLALYRLQEHIGKSLPVMVNRKYTMLETNLKLQGGCFDLDTMLSFMSLTVLPPYSARGQNFCIEQNFSPPWTTEEMKNASQTFFNIREILHECVLYKRQMNAAALSLKEEGNNN